MCLPSSILILWILMTFITTFKIQHYVCPDKSSINLTLNECMIAAYWFGCAVMNSVTCCKRRAFQRTSVGHYTVDCYIAYSIHHAYVCVRAALCTGLYECAHFLCFNVCVSGLCVLKGENNKQRSLTVILHKRPVSFFSLSPGDKMLFCCSASNQPRPQPQKPAPGDVVRMCVWVCYSCVTDTYPIITSLTSRRTSRPLFSLQPTLSLAPTTLALLISQTPS